MCGSPLPLRFSRADPPYSQTRGEEWAPLLASFSTLDSTSVRLWSPSPVCSLEFVRYPTPSGVSLALVAVEEPETISQPLGLFWERASLPQTPRQSLFYCTARVCSYTITLKLLFLWQPRRHASITGISPHTAHARMMATASSSETTDPFLELCALPYEQSEKRDTCQRCR